ncbi:hypothetical protein DBR06_SOUSAS2510067, partial [Sousa chinensis]
VNYRQYNQFYYKEFNASTWRNKSE